MKVILNILTHGDELIGLNVAKELQKLGFDDQVLQVQIANPRAYEAGVRFIDQDLNRAFPGKPNGNYEQQRAHQLLPSIKSADVVIDIHSTTSQLKDAVIVTKLDKQTRDCLQAIHPKYALIMEATQNHALIAHAPVGIAFEYGQENSPTVVQRVVTDINRLLNHLGVIKYHAAKRHRPTQFFRVHSEVKKPSGYILRENVKNYQLIPKGQVFASKEGKELRASEDFYPILFGQNNYEDIFGFMGAKLSEDV